jgi:hypothetical protein
MLASNVCLLFSSVDVALSWFFNAMTSIIIITFLF